MKRIQRAGICLALFCALLPSACQSSRPASVEVSGETVSKVQEKEPSAEGVVSSEPSADTSLPPVPEISSEQESAPESTPASEPESASVPEPVSEEVSEPAPVPLPDEPDEVTEELLLCKDQKHGYSTNEQGLPEGTRIYLDRNIKAGYVVLYDAEKDEILYSKDGEKKIYPASTTKMLTAITAWKVIHDKDYVITVGDEIHLIDPYSSVAGLEEGMQLTLEMMMDAMLMPSGNDAAYVLAVNCGRIYRRDPELSAEEAVRVFMELENRIADRIGAENTHFVTPDGIHDEDHYTTAVDLTKIADYARTIPIIKASCGKDRVEWNLPSGQTVSWNNTNRLLLEDSGQYAPACDGMKTGFTDEAGTCVVASAAVEGHTVIAAVMDGYSNTSKFDDANQLLKAGFIACGLTYTYDS